MKPLSETYKELEIVFSFPIEIRNALGRLTYHENSEGSGCRQVSNGEWIFFVRSTNTNTHTMKPLSETYKELGIAFSFPIEIKDARGNGTYYEDIEGFWCRWEHDGKGNVTYYEDPEGIKRGIARADFEGKVIEVDGIKYKLTAQ